MTQSPTVDGLFPASGPVSIDEPFSAFILPMMSSGSVFGGDYGFVRGGIWQITVELGRINREAMEYQVIRTFLETVAELPWSERSDENTIT